MTIFSCSIWLLPLERGKPYYANHCNEIRNACRYKWLDEDIFQAGQPSTFYNSLFLRARPKMDELMRYEDDEHQEETEDDSTASVLTQGLPSEGKPRLAT